jgi:hypothetical protein
MREKSGLWCKLTQHMRDVRLTLRRKGLLVASAAAERHYDHLPLLRHGLSVQKRASPHQRRTQRKPGDFAQKVSAAA